MYALIKFKDPLAEHSGVIQRYLGYLEELNWHHNQQNEAIP